MGKTYNLLNKGHITVVAKSYKKTFFDKVIDFVFKVAKKPPIKHYKTLTYSRIRAWDGKIQYVYNNTIAKSLDHLVEYL